MRFREIEELIEDKERFIPCEFCGIKYGVRTDEYRTVRMRKDFKCDGNPNCKVKAKYRVEFTDGRIENHFSLRTVKAPGNPSYHILFAIVIGKNTTSERYGIKSIGRYKPNGEYTIAEPWYDNEQFRGNVPGLLPWQECEHCGKSFTPGNYARWHGPKCRQRPGYVAPEKTQKTTKVSKKEQRKARYEVEFTDGRIEHHRSLSTVKSHGNPSIWVLGHILRGNMATSERYGIKSIGKLQPNGEYEIAPQKRIPGRGGVKDGNIAVVDCEHCGKTDIKVTNYAVWHGDNCRENPNYVPREKAKRTPKLSFRVEFVDGSSKEFYSSQDMSEYTGVPAQVLSGIPSERVDGRKYGIISIEKI